MYLISSELFDFSSHRGLSTGIYTTNSPEACHYVAHEAMCNIIVVENEIQLQKILKVRERLPHLKAIVQYTGHMKNRYEDVYTVSKMSILLININNQTNIILNLLYIA